MAEQTYPSRRDELLTEFAETRAVMRTFAESRSMAERVFELEADAGIEVTARYIEREIKGPFPFPVSLGFDRRQVEIDIRGKADRVDLLADGTLRVIDYKLGRMPDVKTAVQLAV